MKTNPKTTVPLDRRAFLRAGSVLGVTSALNGRGLSASQIAPAPSLVRDYFWLWGHYEGSHNGEYGLPASSRITPVEAAYYMGTQNVVMVSYKGKPELPWNQYAIPFRAVQKVVWSAVGAGGATSNKDRQAVFKLAEENPNITGLQMDDFFGDSKNRYRSALSVDELKQLQARLKSGTRKLDLWVTLYTHQLDDPISQQLHYVDIITLWTWKASDLGNLETNMKKTERLSPSTRKVLGIYMWDYGTGQPMTIAAMQQQCNLGLEWLKQGRIEGIIFLGSCICDLNLDAVEWTRNWIKKVGDEKLTTRHSHIAGGRA